MNCDYIGGHSEELRVFFCHEIGISGDKDYNGWGEHDNPDKIALVNFFNHEL